MPFHPLSGPIPGENYTSDTRNYPWHRPPEHTDLDSAIEDAAKKLLSEDGSVGVITMMEMGMDIATMTSIFLMSGIGAGKWTVDQALMIAGPISHILVLMAKGYGIKFNLGIESKIQSRSKAFFDGIKKVDKERAVEAGAGVDLEQVKEKAASGGILGLARQMKGGM